MSARANVLLWAQRVVGRKGAAPHLILEIAPDAGVDVAQEAFHKIARMAHPDLHRTLAPDELELITTAYSRAAAAYQEFRTLCKATSTTRIRPIPASTQPPLAADKAKKTTGSIATAKSTGAMERVNPAQAMTSKALIYYRKAELALRRGDLTGALLQLKMAIASDPQSAFLRTALAEVETEVRKKP